MNENDQVIGVEQTDGVEDQAWEGSVGPHIVPPPRNRVLSKETKDRVFRMQIDARCAYRPTPFIGAWLLIIPIIVLLVMAMASIAGAGAL